MFRLHIDIPISGDEKEALDIARNIITFCFDNQISVKRLQELNVENINFRLGHDHDRQKSNYFIKNENGHVNNKKSKIPIKTSETPIDIDSE